MAIGSLEAAIASAGGAAVGPVGGRVVGVGVVFAAVLVLLLLACSEHSNRHHHEDCHHDDSTDSDRHQLRLHSLIHPIHSSALSATSLFRWIAWSNSARPSDSGRVLCVASTRHQRV